MPRSHFQSGRSAVVTGAGHGIGRAIAVRLADEGYRVTGADLDFEPGLTDRMDTVTCDISNPTEVDELFAVHGPVDVLVTCAGVDLVKPIVELTDADWDRVLRVNLLGTFLCLRAAARAMKAQESAGRIVTIASNRGLGGLENGAPYAASKGGVIALAKSAALELAAWDIAVFSVLPGATDTSMLRKRPGALLNSPEHVASAVMPLLDDNATALSGAAISVAHGSGAPIDHRADAATGG